MRKQCSGFIVDSNFKKYPECNRYSLDQSTRISFNQVKSTVYLICMSLFLVVNLYPYSATAQTCPSFPISVADEAGLNSAIACYNAAAAADYEINLIQNITLTATTTVLNNTQGASLKINGNTHFIDGASTYRIFSVSAGNVTFDTSTLQNGIADTNPCNNTLCGGAILIAKGAVVAVNNSSLNGNSAPNGSGGAILNQGTLSVSNSTFSANITRYGGAINNYESQALTTVSNSTFSGNSAIGRLGAGGAIFQNDGTTSLVNVTVTTNSAGQWGAGIYANSGTAFLSNTIVASNTDNFGGDNSARDCATTLNRGTITAITSLDGDGSCGSATTSASINLGILQDNGGPTKTHALLTGSDAIDAGNNAICTAVPVINLDQRGISRPQNGTCDIGAVELCSSLPSNIANEAQFNAAIACYNTASAGNYEINLNQDITLTATTMALNNSQGATLQINGNAHFIDATNAYRVLTVSAGVISIDKITLQNGTGSNGGALFIARGAEVAITNSSIMGSNSSSGGGIRNNGTLVIGNSLFSGNSTTRSGEGGGLSNYGTAQVIGSSIIGNSAAFGAGLYTRGSLTVSNSTLSANTASGLAGGIYVFWTGNSMVYNSTLSNNSANVGGAVLNNGGTYNSYNSIIANSPRGSNCYGAIGGSNNLTDDGSCGSTTLTDKIMLADLNDNGCVTQHATPSGFACLQTHALSLDSTAIDAADNAICAAAPVNNLDQLGMVRQQDGKCDIGALELIAEEMCFPIRSANGGGAVVCL